MQARVDRGDDDVGLPHRRELRGRVHERHLRAHLRGGLDLHDGVHRRDVRPDVPGGGDVQVRRLVHLHRRGVPVRFGAGLVLLALVASTGLAAADETAKSAYEEGLRAHKAGDFHAAAVAFARADALAPNDTALKAALDAAVRADDPVIGGELLERASTRTLGAAAQASVTAATAKLAHRSGFVRIECTSSCTATVDGKDTPTRANVRTNLGQHAVVVRFPEAADPNGSMAATATVSADQTALLRFQAPPPAPPPPATPPTVDRPPPPVVTPPPPTSSANEPPPFVPPREATAEPSGITPVVFFVGLGVTAVLGATALWSGLATKGIHDDFVAARCATASSAACTGLSDDGSAAQLRTNVLGAVTGVAGVATLVVGIFFTRWKSAPARIAPGPGTAGLSVSVDF